MVDADDLRERVVERMRRDGIPRGTDNPELLAVGAAPLCPEHDLRAAMSDAEFWAHVFPARDEDDRQPDDQEIAEYELNARLADPCPECGQRGACAYDTEGRALIHVTEDDDS
jgi:hypothetical protein